MKKIFIVLTILACLCKSKAQSQVSVTYTQPTPPGLNDGSITIHGLSSKKVYKVRYNKDGEPWPATTLNTNKGTEITISKLGCGVYDNITLLDGANQNQLADIISLGRIGVQQTQFSGAIYTNFTGIADDDPTDFTQYYAMLSQPLRKIYGIGSTKKNRLISFRNLFFRLTYANTDKFKLYSFDSLNSKYVNRLDLFAHAYLNATMSLNLLTYLFPQKRNLIYGDHSHLYLNGSLGFLSTNVSDTLTKDSLASSTRQSVHSLLAGWDATIKFEKIMNSNFQIQTGFKMFWIFTHSGTFNPLLNPQSINVADRNNAQNTPKSIERKHNHPYYAMDVLISYNISSDPSKNTSNVFLHYFSTSNLAKAFGNNYPNYYFQFQLGVALEVTNLFSKPK